MAPWEKVILPWVWLAIAIIYTVLYVEAYKAKLLDPTHWKVPLTYQPRPVSD